MILVYQIQEPKDMYLRVQLYVMDIRRGEGMNGTPYPVQAANLVKKGAMGVRLSPIDHKILMTLVMHQGGNDPIPRINGKTASKVMDLLSQTGRCYIWNNKSKPLTRMKFTLSAKPVWRMEETFFRTGFDLGDGLLSLPGKPMMALDPGGARWQDVDPGMDENAAWAWLATPPMDADASEAFYQRMSERYPGAPLPPPPAFELTEIDDFTPVAALRVRKQEGYEGLSLMLEPYFLYGTREIQPDASLKRIRFMRDQEVVDAQRNFAFEAQAMQTLKAAGYVADDTRVSDIFAAAERKRCLKLDPNSGHTWLDTLSKLFPRLEAEGWHIEHAEGTRPVRPDDEDWYADYEDSGRGWLSFERGVTVEGQRLNLLPAVHAFLRSRRTRSLEEIREELLAGPVPVPGPDCVVMIEGKRFLGMVEHLFELFGGGVLDDKGRLRLSSLRAAELFEDAPGNWQPSPELLDRLRALKGAMDVQPMEPTDTFLGELRPYQKQGAGWLDFLYETRMGGILADDMGLGKTVQVIAALLQWRAREPDAPPVLIVCPTSVLSNWRRECERFAPSLNVRVMHGNDRHDSPSDIESAHVLLTSYTLMRIDEAFYRGIGFTAIILDEAQAIKNPRAKVSKVAGKLQARLKLALTGTPCENHLGDLWSIMNFVQPGFLGGEKDFRSSFRKPIEQEDCQVLRRVLQRRVHPLLLRRTKDLVAPELPPKTEIINTIPLTEKQVELYETVRMAMNGKIQEEMQAKGLARSRIVILDAMLKLRQICCDPRLRLGKEDSATANDSAKILYLRETLPELVEEGRKILLFSQFTSMLDLLHPELDKLGIPYVEIRGNTRDRDTPVQRFQNGEVPLFLISLKAGGSGLNLTAADTVIHFDPWWNPAVEAQATDRAHRIGQQNPVFVYKWVTEGTIENAILALQEAKKGLADLVQVNGEPAISFSEEDLRVLLAPLPVD
ncbi:MAG: DEAD/DEAH box helicase [Verrucomicrobia bacterium]|nr:DEAD/DEAH box helicase [Verrucomicrobiota bacterium]MCH8514556.1 DEAD/DEAH box helicase [Kiritimatiellia bacterium]